MSTSDPEGLALVFTHDDSSQEVRDIAINFVNSLPVGLEDEPTTIMYCRSRYKDIFKRVSVVMDCGGSGITIYGQGSEGKDGLYHIPMHNIRAIAVDYL